MADRPSAESDTRRPPFVGSITELETEHGEGVDRYRVAPLGKALGPLQFGVNHETIFPGGRSSKPHAHSEDDEFVLVLKGQPSLWTDGHLSLLSEGDAIAFPAGTGIAHTFINNSESSVKLLIIGEHSTTDQVHYPLNPEMKHPRPWANAPSRTLGPHNGLADE